MDMKIQRNAPSPCLVAPRFIHAAEVDDATPITAPLPPAVAFLGVNGEEFFFPQMW